MKVSVGLRCVILRSELNGMLLTAVGEVDHTSVVVQIFFRHAHWDVLRGAFPNIASLLEHGTARTR